MKTFWTDCECSCDEHSFRFCYVPNPWEDDPPELYINVYLTKRGFFRRLWTALRYVFGYKCRYGHWDTGDINRKSVQELRGWLDEYIETHDNWQERRYEHLFVEDRHLNIHAAIGAIKQGSKSYTLQINPDDIARVAFLCSAILNRYPPEYKEVIEVERDDEGHRVVFKRKQKDG